MMKTKIKNYIFFALYLLLNPKLLRLVLKGVYIPAYIQYEWLKKYPIRTIIDVGAYCGRVLYSFNYLFPEAELYAFEPIGRNCKAITKKNFSSKLTLENVALSNKVDKALFYENKYLPASSLLHLSRKYRNKYRFMREVKRVRVRTTTLDSYFKDKRLKENIFLKIDAQGTEGAILKGGRKFLKNVSIVHVETSFDEQYEKQVLFEEIYNYLTKAGFKYLGQARESDYYPTFDLSYRQNSVFVNVEKLDV